MANECSGRIPSNPGFMPYYCHELGMTFEFFVDDDGNVYWTGVTDRDYRDVTGWFTLAEVAGAFGWPVDAIKDGIGKYR